MTQRTQFDRAYVTGERVSSGQPEGTPFVNFPDRLLQVLGPAGTPVDLLAVRPFSDEADYLAGDIVAYQGKFYAASALVTAGPFDPADWGSLTAGQFDEIVQGVGWDFTVGYNGEGDADTLEFIKDPLRVLITVSYTDGDPTSILYETSTDSGGSSTPAGTLTLTYTDGEITGGTWS